MPAIQIKIYNQDGNVAGEMDAPAFLSVPWNPSLAHQVFKVYAANKRKNVAHTKTRGEVSGGGIKPWRQKGTGRARQGSSRSPLWRHGGVTFGPRSATDFSQDINKKMLKGALASVLAKKFSLGELKILNNIVLTELKTKNLNRILNNLTDKKSTLLVVANNDNDIFRVMANIKNARSVKARDLNVYDAINYKNIVINKEALGEIKL